MRASNPSRRYIWVLVALLLVAIAGFWLIWRLLWAPPAPSPTATPPATPTVAATEPPAAATATPGPTATPTPAAETPVTEAAVLPSFTAGMYVGYDQQRLAGNDFTYSQGSHLFIPWRQIEDQTRGSRNWSLLDGALNNLAPGKKAIVRVVLRCEDGVDACAPSWTLASQYHPVQVAPSDRCPTPDDERRQRMNYLDPGVKQGLVDMIKALGDRYRDSNRIAAVEIGVGFAGEPVPWPGTATVCDKDAQEKAYMDAGYTDALWEAYHKDIVAAYADAFRGKQALTTLINAAFAEGRRADLVRYAVSRGVGLVVTSLTSDYRSNRGSDAGVCFWGLSTQPDFSNASPNADAAYITHWAPLPVNAGVVPIGFEFNNRSDKTGRVPPLPTEIFTWWAMFNALDKRADYVLPFNDRSADQGGEVGNVRWKAPWEFFNRYVGRSSASTPDAWIAFRGPWRGADEQPVLLWCPDVYDYSWYLTSELETLPYDTRKAQDAVNAIDAATAVYDVGPDRSDWRGAFARKTTDDWPAFNLDLNDDVAARLGRSVDVAVTYFDHPGGGEWKLWYDSLGGKKLAGTVKLTGTNTWQEKVFSLSDARLANGLPKARKDSRAVGFDLQLDRADGIDDIFQMVVVRPGPSPTPPPSTTPTLTPTGTATAAPGSVAPFRIQQGVGGYQGALDTTLSSYAAEQRLSFAADPLLFAERDNIRSTLIRFDLGALPPDSRVQNASLVLKRADTRP